jgi:hypothetical protein
MDSVRARELVDITQLRETGRRVLCRYLQFCVFLCVMCCCCGYFVSWRSEPGLLLSVEGGLVLHYLDERILLN